MSASPLTGPVPRTTHQEQALTRGGRDGTMLTVREGPRMESGREEVTVVNQVKGEASKLEGHWMVFDACHQAQGGVCA